MGPPSGRSEGATPVGDPRPQGKGQRHEGSPQGTPRSNKGPDPSPPHGLCGPAGHQEQRRPQKESARAPGEMGAHRDSRGGGAASTGEKHRFLAYNSTRHREHRSFPAVSSGAGSPLSSSVDLCGADRPLALPRHREEGRMRAHGKRAAAVAGRAALARSGGRRGPTPSAPGRDVPKLDAAPPLRAFRIGSPALPQSPRRSRAGRWAASSRERRISPE